MKQLSILFLFCLLFAACSDDDKEKESILVTNIVIMDADKVFKPGETITVSAQGFREGDQFLIDMRWPLADPSGPIKEGNNATNAILQENSDTSITFLVPGRCPAATLNIILIRGEKQMTLGHVAVADGQAPKEQQLYGITNSYSMSSYPYGIDKIDLTTGEVTEVTRLPQDKDFYRVVSIPNQWSLIGKMNTDGKPSVATYDLSMNHWSIIEDKQLVTFCMHGSGVSAIYQVTDEDLAINTLSDIHTRMNTPPMLRTYQLPKGMKADALAGYIGVITSEGQVILSADNGDGTFSPVTIQIQRPGLPIAAYDPIKADALIPFWIAVSRANNDMKTAKIVCGFAVVSKSTNSTELRLWNTTTNSLDEPFATFPYGNPIRSIATHFTEDMKTQELYLLMEGRSSGGLIKIYDLQKKEWRDFSFGFPYSEIVFAR